MRRSLRFIITAVVISLIAGWAAPTAKAQKATQRTLVGFWHHSKTVGNGLDRAYRFHADGRFVFQFSGFDDIGRIRSLQGRYRFVDDTLYLRVDSRIERTGGNVVRGAEGYQDEWVLEESAPETVPQPDAGEEALPIRFPRGKPARFVLWDRADWMYYRLSENPDFEAE
jgi:hypothetical protein